MNSLYRNKYEIAVFAPTRSGHHAIINWIKAHFLYEDMVFFINNVDKESSPFEFWGVGDSDGDFIDRNSVSIAKKDLLIYNYERNEYLVKDVFTDHFYLHRDNFVGRSLNRFDALVLRDPFNMFASQFKRFNNNVLYFNSANTIETWKSVAREYIGITRYIKAKPIRINYNEWVNSKEYRRKIIVDQLGLIFLDYGTKSVPSFAGGSSFVGTDKDGKANEMKVFERWKEYQHNQAFFNFFDQEIIELSNEIFGHIEGTEIFK